MGKKYQFRTDREIEVVQIKEGAFTLRYMIAMFGMSIDKRDV